MPPETRYAKSGDVHLAYQVLGEGPLDLVFVHGWVSNGEYGWELPQLSRFQWPRGPHRRPRRRRGRSRRGLGLLDRQRSRGGLHPLKGVPGEWRLFAVER